MLQVQWINTYGDGNPITLGTLDLGTVTAQGIYIIWYRGSPGRVVRLGQGDVSNRLGAHRADPAITNFGKTNGQLYVTWAEIPALSRDGVERYLANLYPPLVGDAFPDVVPIAVNAPW